MATASSSWSTVHSTEIIENTNTSVTIRVTVYWKNSNWKYNINHVAAWVYCNGVERQVKTSGSLVADSDYYGQYSLGYSDFTITKTTATQSIPCYGLIVSNSSYASGTKYSASSNVSVSAKPSHTVTYNANGGSGAPANQTKWYNESITLSSTVPVRTGHSFVNWCTNTSNTGTKYSPGATYSSNANLTLYAIWKANTYTVTYNANGGSGAPSAQTKTYGTDLTLSTTKPTRTNYNFKGWSTSADGSVTYASGATYTNNSAVTLYAVWELAYIKPRINNFAVQRCTSDGTVSENGTYIKVTFGWTTDKTVSSIKIEWKTVAATSWTSSTVTASGTSGTVSQVVGSGAISTDTSYSVKASVSDSGGTTPSPTLTIGTINYPIDVKNGGTGVAIGKAAENANEFDVNWDARFRKGITVDWGATFGSTLLVSKKATLVQGSTVKNLQNGSGTSGYMLACRITINQSYANQFIIFGVTQRSRVGEIHLNFQSISGHDPALGTFKRIGNIAAYIVKNTTSVWDLYIGKSEAYDSIDITELHKGVYMSDVTIEWINSTVSSLPSGYTTATGAISFEGSVNINGTDGTRGYKTNGNMILKNSGSNTVLAAVGSNNIYLRPNGMDVDTNRFLFKTDGSLTGYSGETRINGAKTLYDNSSGTTGTVTLSETAANFQFIEIFYGDNGHGYRSEMVYAPNAKMIEIEHMSYDQSSSSNFGYIWNFKAMYISGTSITANLPRRIWWYPSNTKLQVDASNNIKVVRVVGYK